MKHLLIVLIAIVGLSCTKEEPAQKIVEDVLFSYPDSLPGVENDIYPNILATELTIRDCGDFRIGADIKEGNTLRVFIHTTIITANSSIEMGEENDNIIVQYGLEHRAIDVEFISGKGLCHTWFYLTKGKFTIHITENGIERTKFIEIT